MVQTTIFKNNKSQSVRLPKPVALPEDVKKVDVVAVGNRRIISPAGTAWDDWFEEGSGIAGFIAKRAQPVAQKRESFDD